MNRRDLVKAIAAQTDQDIRQVDETLRGFTDVVTAVVAKGEPVAISGFCKFSKVERPARMGRNPATGEQIKIKASKKARITPLKAFKDSVMTPSQAPKLARGVWPAAPAAAKPASRAAASKPAATRAKAAKPAARRATTAAKPAARRTAAAKPAATRAKAAKPAARTTRRPAAKPAARTTTRRAAATRRSR
jgi:DNA-binding protein HU-beta